MIKMKSNIATQMIEVYNFDELLSDEQFHAVERAMTDMLQDIINLSSPDTVEVLNNHFEIE